MNIFKNIPNKYRPIPFWSWNEKLEIGETARQCRVMKDVGIGGYFMHARGGLQTEYMGEEWFENIEAGIREAEELGMDAWLYDENGWPSGFGDGIVNGMGQEYQQKYLRCEKGEKNTENTICNIDDYHFYYEVNPFYVDLMDKKVVRAFIDSIYEPYYKRFGERIKGIFTDEPQLSRNGMPWSFVLPDAYKERYGEELYSGLIMLFEKKGDYKSFRIKFWKLVTDLFCEAFSKQIYQWCLDHNWEFTGHMALEEHLEFQVLSNGAVSPHYEYFTMPGIDWLGRPIDRGMAQKQLGSAASQLGKDRVLTESFAMCGHNVSFDELRRITEWQMVRGITNICPHLEGYSLRGIRKRDYPPAMYYQQPWWEVYPEFVEEMSRAGAIMGEGRELCDTLLIHPMTEAWTVYELDNFAPIYEVEDRFLSEIEILEGNNIMFHVGDETIMERHARVEGDKIVIGTQTYDKVVMVGDEWLLDSTKKLLTEYTDNGGRIVRADEIPRTTIIDNKEITYTRRDFDGYCVHYLVNSTDMEQKTTITRGSKRINLATGELEDFCHDLVLPRFSSVMVYDDGTYNSVEGKTQKRIDLSGVWQVKGATENAITLDVCDVYFDGELAGEKEDILTVQNMACAVGKPLNVRCVFKQNMEYIPENLQLICEMPDLFEIKINGEIIDKTDKGWFVDKAFRRIDISRYAHTGENTIELICEFAQSDKVYENIKKAAIFESERNKLTFDVELEPIYLIGDFAVFPKGEVELLDRNAIRTAPDFIIEKPLEEIELQDIESQGYLFFAGELTVEKKLDIVDTNMAIAFNKEGINAVRVAVNGREVTTSLWSFEPIDLSDYLVTGKNTITLTLINNLRNLMGPHHLEEGESLAVTPRSFAKTPRIWESDTSALPWNDGYCFVTMSVK